MLVKAADLDLPNWGFDFGPAVKTDEILSQLKEALENTLATEEPCLDAYVNEGETDLVIYVSIYALGDNGPVYKFNLSEVVGETLVNCGDDLDDLTSLLTAFRHLCARVEKSIEEIATEPKADPEP